MLASAFPTVFSYDVHGRLLSKEIGSAKIPYTYDNNGNQLTITDSTGTTARTYDAENRVLTKTVPDIGTITYQYDILEADGCYSEISEDPKNNVTKKIYDKVGRLMEVIEENSSTAFEYCANGSKNTVIYPDGSREDYTYYKDNLLKTLVNTKGDGTVLDSYSYTYDGAHNQTSKTDNKGLTRYEYDSLNRLYKVTEPNGKETSYLYDKAGNRTQETVLQNNSSKTTVYSYNEQNRLTDTVTRSGYATEKTRYEYDNNGNTLIKVKETTKPVDPEISGDFTFEKAGTSTSREVSFMDYDVWNQMIKTIQGDKTIRYRYNGEGYRVEKSVNDTTTKYMYEADKVILEVDGQGSETAKNTYGTGILSRAAGNDTAYYMYNGHGDVTALLNSTGSVLTTYYYDAFGNLLETTGEASNPFRYAGYQYDEETGVYYLNARYYDPKIARFLTEDTYRGDPNDPLSLNLYTYCNSEPMMYTDPSGHSLLSLIGVGIGIGAVVGIISDIISGSSGNSGSGSNDDDDDDDNGGSGSNSNNNTGGNHNNKPKTENVNGKGGNILSNIADVILEKVESLKSLVKYKDTDSVTSLGGNKQVDGIFFACAGNLSGILYNGKGNSPTLNSYTKYTKGMQLEGVYSYEGTDKPEVLVVIAAGINTNRADNLFGDFKTEIESRYNEQGMAVRFVEVYPLKEVKDTNALSQIVDVGVNFSKMIDVTGQAVVDAVKQNNENVVKTIIIGHSGGGVAVGDAIRLAGEQGVSVDKAIQIGAPSAGVDPKYVDKVLRVEAKSDTVANIVQSPGGYGPMGVGKPEIRKVNINVEGQPFGGHSAYFNSRLINSQGVNNVTTTVDAMWDKIK